MKSWSEGSEEFVQQLLQVMEQKRHWAWAHFTSGQVPLDRLSIHFEQEYETYVRDFPILVGHAYVQCPVAEVRRELAENLYEEETGGLVAKRPHPELFLEYPRGLGMDLERFRNVQLLPAARSYRQVLDEATQRSGWEVAAAVSTLFIEGTQYERGEIEPGAPRRPAPPLEQHPLVVHYGLSIEHLALTKAHREVEGSHRASAWRMIVGHVSTNARPAVVQSMQRALEAWLAYRDGVAQACGVVRRTDAQSRAPAQESA